MAFIYDGKDLDKLDDDEVLDIYNKMTPEEQFTYSKYKAEQEAEPGFNYDLATKRTFTESVEPYEFLMGIDNGFKRKQEVIKMQNKAVDLGLIKTQFKKLWEAYQDEHNGYKSVEMDNLSRTQFTGQDQEYKTSWIATDNGVYKQTEHGKKVACSHPIYVSKRLINIDSGLESVVIRYKTHTKWRSVTVDKSKLTTINKITELASYGISVTSQNANNLIEYLQELQDINIDILTVVDSSNRLGWYDGINEFLPYSKDLYFDGDSNLSRLFDSVHTAGIKDKWIETVSSLWERGIVPKLVLSSSAGSVLVKLVGGLVNFFHVWSPESGSGKTVYLKLASSFWGKPNVYMQSFNSTRVAQEYMAGTLKDLPLILDELQTQNNNRGGNYFSVYFLAQGQGKNRANTDGTLRAVEQWQNIILTSGETPLLNDAVGEGAFARTIQVKLDKTHFTYVEGNQLDKTLNKNYGWGGYLLVNVIQDLGVDKIQDRFTQICMDIDKQIPNVHEKHIGLGAIEILASELICKYVLNLDQSQAISVKDIEPFLLKKEVLSVSKRAYDFIIDWVASNKISFKDDARERLGTTKINKDGSITIFIIKTKFNEVLKREGFSPKAVLSEWEEKGITETTTQSDGTVRNGVRAYINGIQTWTIPITIDSPSDGDEESEDKTKGDYIINDIPEGTNILAETFGWEKK